MFFSALKLPDAVLLCCCCCCCFVLGQNKLRRSCCSAGSCRTSEDSAQRGSSSSHGDSSNNKKVEVIDLTLDSSSDDEGPESPAPPQPPPLPPPIKRACPSLSPTSPPIVNKRWENTHCLWMLLLWCSAAHLHCGFFRQLLLPGGGLDIETWNQNKKIWQISGELMCWFWF